MRRFIRWLLRQRLRVFTDDYDAVIAYSVRDAARVMREACGADVDLEFWGEVDDEYEISIHCNDAGEPTEPDGDDDTGVRTMTAAEWVRRRGRGFLCTTEC